MNSEKTDVIIIGAGASGLMAACIASSRGKNVIVLEKMQSPARKLRITGKGRCNITNTATQSDFLKHIGPNPRFLKYSFSKFFSKELIDFFNTAGVKTIIEQGGRVFPESEKAQDVSDALIKTAKKNNSQILCLKNVRNIITKNNTAIGVKLYDENIFHADKIILSTGGLSYPATGSTGHGYLMAKEIGHTVSQLYPALVPFETKGDTAQKMQGLSLKNVKVFVWIEGKKITDAFGEMLFTHYGISGPVILSLSRKIIKEVKSGKNVEISIDLKPALEHDKLDKRLVRDINEHGKKSFNSLLKLLLPSSMIPVFIEKTGINPEKPAHQVTAEERKKIRLLLKDFRLQISNARGYDEAIITSGGIPVNEINPDTMESKIIKNLYFCGEIIDLDADTGGYNLQVAFSTAYIAGISV